MISSIFLQLAEDDAAGGEQAGGKLGVVHQVHFFLQLCEKLGIVAALGVGLLQAEGAEGVRGGRIDMGEAEVEIVGADILAAYFLMLQQGQQQTLLADVGVGEQEIDQAVPVRLEPFAFAGWQMRQDPESIVSDAVVGVSGQLQQYPL